jgi:hypothetical protein
MLALIIIGILVAVLIVAFFLGRSGDFNKKGTITIPFFSKSKILTLPVQNTHNVSIRCKSIRVKDIDIYVKDSEGKYILDEVYREKLRSQLENNNNTIDHV